MVGIGSLYSWQFVARCSIATLVAFGLTVAIAIICSRSINPSAEYQDAIYAGVVSAALALVASARVRSVAAGTLSSAGAIATVAFAVSLGYTTTAVVPAVIGTLAGVFGHSALRCRWFVACGTVSVIALIVLAAVRAAPHIEMFAYVSFFFCALSISAVLSQISSYIERIALGALGEMGDVMKPAIAFVSAYGLTAFVFALVYGVCYYTLPGSIKYDPPGGNPSLLVLFQWSLATLVTAGPSELKPESTVARFVYISQLLVNLFIMTFYVGHFLSHAKSVLSRERLQ